MTRLRALLPSLLVLLVLPAPTAGAATVTFPGCGATIQSCINAASPGSTIKLRTNNLVQIPADPGWLKINKALTIEAARGFKPKLGRPSDPGYIEVSISPSSPRTVAFRGITFQQVSTSIEIGGSSTGHRVIFEKNRVNNDSGTNGGSGISVYFNSPAEGSVLIRNNFINSAGSGIEARVHGGPLTITGNRTTSPVFGDSQGGIFVYAGGDGTVKGTIASNLVYGVAGCGCGSPSGIHARAFDTVTFALRIVNNTVSPAPAADPSAGQAYGIVIVDPYSHPDATINASLYNNLVTNSHSGIVLYEDDQLNVRGNMNNTFNVVNGDSLGSYDLGTTLHDDPLYESTTNFRLQPGSPMRNAGQSCIGRIPLPRGDAARMFRLSGAAVDIGAYESGSKLRSRVPGRNITGTESSQTLVGGGGLDVICALGGHDVVDGRGSRDFILGGNGNDRLRGSDGMDRIYGGNGKDRVSGGNGSDYLNVKDGITGNDRVDGGPSRDKCVTDAGDIKKSCG